MKVLVAVASKHRSTLEIGQAIGRGLSTRGIPTDIRPAADVDLVSGYDAVIVGSGVYAGNWLPAARDLVSRNAIELGALRVWLFSSGPMGNPPVPAGDPDGVKPLIELIAPRGHRVFAGRLEASDLGLAEKVIVKVVRAPAGDFRDWQAVDDWAAEIAAELLVGGAPSRTTAPEIPELATV